MRRFFKDAFLSGATLRNITIAGMLCFGIPIFVHAGYSDHPKFHKFLEDVLELSSRLGDALLIAVILVITIDEESRIKLIDAVVRAASPRLIGRHLPESVQGAVLRYFKIDFFRPELRISYDLEPIEPDGEYYEPYLKITMRVKGSLRNCGTDQIQFPFFGAVDPPVLLNVPKPSITIARVQKRDGTVIFEKSEPASKAVSSIQESLPLLPKTEYVTTFESITYKPLTYFLPLFVGTTVVHTYVTVRFPKHLLDVQLQLSAQSLNDPIPEETQFGNEWDLREPILPGNCILTMWHPRFQVPNENEQRVAEDKTRASGDARVVKSLTANMTDISVTETCTERKGED